MDLTGVPALLRRRSSDEYAPLPWSAAERRALASYRAIEPLRIGLSASDYAVDRRGTAATLRAIDAAHGGGYYVVPEEAVHELDAADAAFRGDAPVVDVQTHLVDPGRWHGAGADALGGFLRMVDPDRWPDRVDPHAIDAAAWAAHVFGASETAVALLTSTPGPADTNVLTNTQIGAARDLVDRYAGTGRVLTHAIVHPNLGEAELDAMTEWSAALRPSGWKCYTLWGPPTKASPSGGWFLDDEEVGFPFLERVRAHLARRSLPRTRDLAARSPMRRSPPRRRATSGPRRRRSLTSRSSCTTLATSATLTARKARTIRITRRAASTGW